MREKGFVDFQRPFVGNLMRSRRSKGILGNWNMTIPKP